MPTFSAIIYKESLCQKSDKSSSAIPRKPTTPDTKIRNTRNQEVIETLPGRSDKIIDIIMYDPTKPRTKQGNELQLVLGLVLWVISFQVLALLLIAFIKYADAESIRDSEDWRQKIHLLFLIPGGALWWARIKTTKKGQCMQLTRAGHRIDPPADKRDPMYPVIILGEGWYSTYPGFDAEVYLAGRNTFGMPKTKAPEDQFQVQIDTGVEQEKKDKDGKTTTIVMTHWEVSVNWMPKDERMLDAQESGEIERLIARRIATQCRFAATAYCKASNQVNDVRDIISRSEQLEVECNNRLKDATEANPSGTFGNAEYFDRIGVTIEDVAIHNIFLPKELEEAEEGVSEADSRARSAKISSDAEIKRYQDRTAAGMGKVSSVVSDIVSRIGDFLKDIFDNKGGSGK